MLRNRGSRRKLVLQEGDVAGIKTVTIEIDGDYAFGFLKGENGGTSTSAYFPVRFEYQAPYVLCFGVCIPVGRRYSLISRST